MTTSEQPNKPRRYYGDDCRIDPALDFSEFNRLLHAAYTHWVAKNFHVRDFAYAVEHCASMAYVSFAMDGNPQLTGELPALVAPPLAIARKEPATTAATRLYDELDSLSPEIDLKMLDGVLAGLFIHWVSAGWHARDFVQAAQDSASNVIYDHQLCSSFGGLGGGKTGEQFMTTPYGG